MDDGGVLWRNQRASTTTWGRAGEECNAGCCCSISLRPGSWFLVLGPWFLVLRLCVSACMRVCLFPLGIGPVNSNPAAVEVSAKAGLAGLCRLYADCWAGG